MNKPRAPSDPIPTSEPYNDHEQTFSSTLPSRVPREQRIAEPFPAISATALLGMDVSHSGWVRKEGYGYRSCEFFLIKCALNLHDYALG